jgi:hypothetical protein
MAFTTADMGVKTRSFCFPAIRLYSNFLLSKRNLTDQFGNEDHAWAGIG